MREIKFDAIYIPTGEHFKPIDIRFNDNTITGNFDGGINDWCHFSLDGKRGDVILRQYTGIKDRSGKEIYEGDIVIIRNKEEQYVIQEDGFMDTAFVPGWEMKGEVKFLYHCWFIEGPDGKGCPIDFGGEEGLEVLGNVYEEEKNEINQIQSMG